jgi:hypothetical protein
MEYELEEGDKLAAHTAKLLAQNSSPARRRSSHKVQTKLGRMKTQLQQMRPSSSHASGLVQGAGPSASPGGMDFRYSVQAVLLLLLLLLLLPLFLVVLCTHHLPRLLLLHLVTCLPFIASHLRFFGSDMQARVAERSRARAQALFEADQHDHPAD